MIGLEALVAGPVCGGSMNPARSLAPALVSGHLEYLWIYLISPVIGSLAAIPLFQFLRGTSGNTVPILSRE
jgi:aquaporin Z